MRFGSYAPDIPQDLPDRIGAPYSYFKRRFVAPGECTIRRVLEETEAAALDLAVGAWLFARATRDDDGDLVIALDGKVLRGAWTDEKQQVTLFSVMFHREGVVVAQTQVPDGTNEITQVENLLENIATAPGRTIVTLDAAHTQRETALYYYSPSDRRVVSRRGYGVACGVGRPPRDSP